MPIVSTTIFNTPNVPATGRVPSTAESSFIDYLSATRADLRAAVYGEKEQLIHDISLVEKEDDLRSLIDDFLSNDDQTKQERFSEMLAFERSGFHPLSAEIERRQDAIDALRVGTRDSSDEMKAVAKKLIAELSQEIDQLRQRIKADFHNAIEGHQRNPTQSSAQKTSL